MVRGDSVNPLLIFHAQNIGSNYMSPQWRLAPMPEILTFIMTFAGHTPNTPRLSSFYGDAVAQYAALYKENTQIRTDKVSGEKLILVINCVAILFMHFLC